MKLLAWLKNLLCCRHAQPIHTPLAAGDWCTCLECGASWLEERLLKERNMNQGNDAMNLQPAKAKPPLGGITPMHSAAMEGGACIYCRKPQPWGEFEMCNGPKPGESHTIVELDAIRDQVFREQPDCTGEQPSHSVNYEEIADRTQRLAMCRKCGCLWRLWKGGWWSLADAHQRPGKCCDNSPDFERNVT